MADQLSTLLLEDSDEETIPTQGNTNGLSDSNGDFFARLAAINSVSSQAASNQPETSQQLPATSPAPNKGTLIFDPTHVLANQQQKAAASRPPSADPSAYVASSAPTALPQHSVAMSTHASGTVHRPSVQAPVPAQPRQGDFGYIQNLLGFADKRWQATNQLNKCKEARNLVATYKQQRQASGHTQEMNKPLQGLFQTNLLKIIGPELRNEFDLLHYKSGQSQVSTAGQPNQVAHQQQPRNGMPHTQQTGMLQQQQQVNAMPRAAVSQAQQHAHHQYQHLQPQGPQAGMMRPAGVQQGFAGPAASQGMLMQRQPSAQHPQHLQQGQQQQQPGMRAQSPVQQLQLQQPGHMQQQGLGHAQLAAPAGAQKRPASGPAAAPAPKRQAFKQEGEGDDTDVLHAAGVDEDAEQEALLGRSQPVGNRGPAPPAARILNPHPLQAKVQQATQQYELQGAHSSLQPYLNQAIWQHLEGILTQATKMATQRADLSRKQEGFQTTTDVRKALGDKAKVEKEKALVKEEAERKALLEASKNKDGDEDVQRKVKEAQKEELEKQNRAQTNSALSSALGGGARWKNWGKKASGTAAKSATPTAEGGAAAPAAKPSTGSSLAAKAAAAAASKASAAQAASAITGLPGASRALLPPSRLIPDGQIVSLKDVIAVLERHPVYCKSNLLYKLYDKLDG